jgi:hypothetical protein
LAFDISDHAGGLKRRLEGLESLRNLLLIFPRPDVAGVGDVADVRRQAGAQQIDQFMYDFRRSHATHLVDALGIVRRCWIWNEPPAYFQLDFSYLTGGYSG